MDSDYALVESLRLINSNLEKVTKRIEVLENDYKERYYKKRFIRWLITFYPTLLIFLLFIIDLDHKKIADVASDINALIQDTRNISMAASSNED